MSKYPLSFVGVLARHDLWRTMDLCDIFDIWYLCCHALQWSVSWQPVATNLTYKSWCSDSTSTTTTATTYDTLSKCSTNKMDIVLPRTVPIITSDYRMALFKNKKNYEYLKWLWIVWHKHVTQLQRMTQHLPHCGNFQHNHNFVAFMCAVHRDIYAFQIELNQLSLVHWDEMPAVPLTDDVGSLSRRTGSDAPWMYTRCPRRYLPLFALSPLCERWGPAPSGLKSQRHDGLLCDVYCKKLISMGVISKQWFSIVK